VSASHLRQDLARLERELRDATAMAADRAVQLNELRDLLRDKDAQLRAATPGPPTRACHVEPDARFATVRELRVAVEGYLQHRASTQLAARAQARLAALEPLLQARPTTTMAAGRSRLPSTKPASASRRHFATGRATMQRGTGSLRRSSAWSPTRLFPDPRPDVVERITSLRRRFDPEGIARIQLAQMRKERALRTHSWAPAAFVAGQGLFWALAAVTWSALLRHDVVEPTGLSPWWGMCPTRPRWWRFTSSCCSSSA
jgi:hypothetical protein